MTSPPNSSSLIFLNATRSIGVVSAGVFNVTLARGEDVKPSKICKGQAFALLEIVEPLLHLARAPVFEAGGSIDAVALHLIGADRIQGHSSFCAIAAHRGDCVFYDLMDALDLSFTRATTDPADIIIFLPRVRLPNGLANLETLNGLKISSETPAGRIIGAALKALSAEGERATDREFDAMAEGVLALIAAAIAPTLENQRGGPPPLASFLAIRRYVDKNIQTPGLNGDSLAKTFGLSRASLYRLFEPVGGVASYIRAERLRRAYREIVDAEFADRRIGPIAYGLGFKNISAFNRLFREEFGASPRKLRAGRASSEPTMSASPPKEGEFTLLHWLRQAGAVPRPARGS